MIHKMDKFKLVIAGGRNFQDFDLLCKSVDKALSLRRPQPIEIVCGMCKGADILGLEYAEIRGYKVIHMHAAWYKYGKSAGYRRNEDMAKISDASIVFWDGKSKGTKHMIDLTKKHNNKLTIINY